MREISLLGIVKECEQGRLGDASQLETSLWVCVEGLRGERESVSPKNMRTR